MGLFSQIPVVQNLMTTVNNTTGLDLTGVDAAVGLDLGLGQPTAPVLDLGAALGGTGPLLTVDAPLLDPLLNALPASLELTTPLASVSLQDGLSIAVNLDTASVPAVDLNLTLGGGDPLIAIDAQILDLGATTPSLDGALSDIVDSVLPDLSLDVGLGLGTGNSPAPTPADPSAPTPVDPPAPATGSGPDASPTPDAPTSPSTPSIGVGIDIGLGGGTSGTPAPSTDGTAAPVDTGGENNGGVDVPPAPIETGSGGFVSWNGGTLPGVAVSVGAEAIGGFGGGMSFAQSVDWSGRDLINGNDGDNTLMGLAGNDTIYGHGGDDVLYGNQNDDRLYGGFGNDTIHGGRDNDFVSGDEGDDQLWGDYGDDTLEGGEGADMFCFDIRSGNDIILDFNAAEGDRLNFQGQEYAIHEIGGTAIITLSGGGAVMLSGVSAAHLDAYIVG